MDARPLRPQWRDAFIVIVATFLVPVPFAAIDTWSEMKILLGWQGIGVLFSCAVALIIGLRLPGRPGRRAAAAFITSWVLIGLVSTVFWQEYANAGGWFTLLVLAPILGILAHGLLAWWVAFRVRRSPGTVGPPTLVPPAPTR